MFLFIALKVLCSGYKKSQVNFSGSYHGGEEMKWQSRSIFISVFSGAYVFSCT